MCSSVGRASDSKFKSCSNLAMFTVWAFWLGLLHFVACKDVICITIFFANNNKCTYIITFSVFYMDDSIYVNIGLTHTSNTWYHKRLEAKCRSHKYLRVELRLIHTSAGIPWQLAQSRSKRYLILPFMRYLRKNDS